MPISLHYFAYFVLKTGDDDTADVGIPAAFLYSVEAAVLMSLLSDHGFEQLHAELNRPTLPADTS